MTFGLRARCLSAFSVPRVPSTHPLMVLRWFRTPIRHSSIGNQPPARCGLATFSSSAHTCTGKRNTSDSLAPAGAPQEAANRAGALFFPFWHLAFLALGEDSSQPFQSGALVLIRPLTVKQIMHKSGLNPLVFFNKVRSGRVFVCRFNSRHPRKEAFRSALANSVS